MSRIYGIYKAIKNGTDVFNSAKSSKSKLLNSKAFTYLLSLGLVALSTYFIYTFINNIFETFGAQEMIFNAISMMFLQATNIMVLVMGVLYAPNMLFMGDDNKILLPLPVKPWELFFAKMMVLYVNMLQMVAIFAIPVFVSCGILLEFGVSYYIYAVLITLAIPAIPVAIACLLSTILVTIAPVKISKDAITFISTAFIMVAVVAFNLFTNTENTDKLITMFTESKISGTLSYVFPNINLSMNLLKNENVIISVLLLIAITIGSMAIVCFLVSKPFYRSLSTLQDSSRISKKKKVLKQEKSRGKFRAYLKKEMRMLIRTTPNITYLFLMGVYMPVIMMISFVFNPNMGDLSAELDFSNPMVINVMFWIFMGIMTYQCGVTQSGLTAISSEGKSFYIMKYLPVEIKTQLKAKLLSRMTVFIVPVVLLMGIFIYVLRPPVILSAAFLITSIMMVFATTLIQMFYDIKFPKLDWLSEQQMFGGFRMIIPLVIFIGAFAGVCFGLFKLNIEGNTLIYVFNGILIVLSVIFYLLVIKDNALEKIE